MGDAKHTSDAIQTIISTYCIRFNVDSGREKTEGEREGRECVRDEASEEKLSNKSI